jgi:hypothetical protein
MVYSLPLVTVFETMVIWRSNIEGNRTLVQVRCDATKGMRGACGEGEMGICEETLYLEENFRQGSGSHVLMSGATGNGRPESRI